jgi:hypothetical protein
MRFKLITNGPYFLLAGVNRVGSVLILPSDFLGRGDMLNLKERPTADARLARVGYDCDCSELPCLVNGKVNKNGKSFQKNALKGTVRLIDKGPLMGVGWGAADLFPPCFQGNLTIAFK